MLVTVNPNTAIDLKAALLAKTGNAVVDGTVVAVEWAENPNAGNNIFLVSTPDDINSFDAYDGVILSGDTSSVNFVRGVEATSDNIFIYNAGKAVSNLIVYTN